MLYKKHLSEPHFSNIKKGLKKVEGRLHKGTFAKLKIDDIVEWFNDETGKIRKVKTKIVSIKKYKTFEDMIRKERLKNTLLKNNYTKLTIYY